MGRLVTIIRRHGIRISDIDPHEQMLVVELRREFEPLVAARAARRATIDERRYLSKTADFFMEAGATVDVMKFLRILRVQALHRCLRTQSLYRQRVCADQRADPAILFVYQRETKDVARAAALHAAVLKAIASGDETAAADAARAMVDYAEYYTRSVIVGRTTI